MDEAQGLHEQVKSAWPRQSDDPAAYLKLLDVARGASARLTELRVNTITARGAMRRAAADTKRQADEAWDLKVRDRPAKGQDFTGPRERYSEYNVATLDERRRAHLADQLRSEVEETYEVLRVIAEEVRGAGEDAKRAMSHLQWAHDLSQ